MSEDEEFLRQLDELTERSKSAEYVDASVDFTSKSSVRKSAMVKLDLLHKEIQGKYAQATQFGGSPHVIIRSHRGSYRPHRLVQDVAAGDERFRTALTQYGELWVKSVDTPYDRSLYFSEYESRFNALYDAIAHGRLDRELATPPDLLIHEVMGFSGELLPVLGVDPKLGETYLSLERERVEMENMSRPAESETDKASNNWDKLNKTLREIGLNVSAKANPQQTPVDDPDVAEGILSTPPNQNPGKGIVLKVLGYDVEQGVRVIYSKLGLVLLSVDEEIRRAMNLGNEVEGLLVIDVLKGFRAEKAGFHPSSTSKDLHVASRGDIIVSVEDIYLQQAADLDEYLNRYHPAGRPIKFKVLREEKFVVINVY